MPGKYKRKDHYYQEAKKSGKVSRAYYKLRELDQRQRLFKKGLSVIDLGCWPGGWLKYASERVGPQGQVIGIDIVPIEDLIAENIEVISGDIREEELLQKALKLNDGRFNLLLSDLSPKLSGIKEVDRLAAAGLAESALWAAGIVLKAGGNFVVKVFKSNETEEFAREARKSFGKMSRIELKASRKTSTEFYLVGIGFKEAE